MVVSSAAAVRRRLASLGARKFAPAAHRGTERLLRAPGRADFRAAHAALFAAGRVDAVATGTNAATPPWRSSIAAACSRTWAGTTTCRTTSWAAAGGARPR
jgi:hypothetical protein